jgi:DNA-binding NarL/FixJ family response regulator
MSEAPISVVIVDDHNMFAESLARLLGDEADIDVAGTARSSASAIDLVRAVRPDVAILDHRLPDGEGPVTAARIRSVSPDTRVLMLTGAASRQLVVAAVEAGCSGFLTKDKAVHELVAAVRLAHAGGAYLSPAVLAELLSGLGTDRGRPGPDLSLRQREVLQLVAAGLANRAIADRLSLSVHTVRNHVQNILAKLEAHSKLEAVLIAAREGLLERFD